MRSVERKLIDEVIGGISRFQKINIVFILFFISTMLFTILKANLESSFVSIIPFILFSSVFVILEVSGESLSTKTIQVIFLLSISFFLIITNPIIYQVGYLLLIFVYFLSRKYNLFHKRLILYHILLLILLCVSIAVSSMNFALEEFTVSAHLTFWHIAIQFNFIIAIVILIYIVFEDDIKRLTVENKKLNTHIEKSKVFVNLGENIAGLVHNLNGDIGLISMSLSLLEDELEHPAIQFAKEGNSRLQAKVRNILTLAKYSQIDDNIEFSINALLHSLVEVYSMDKRYKRIRVEKDFQNEVMFFGNTSEIAQIFENLIKNAYEALIEKWKSSDKLEIGKFTPLLTISIIVEADISHIKFRDNGPGIEACLRRDCSGECSRCKVFQVGRTTKKQGHGLGMNSVLRTLNKYKGDIKIESSAEGSEISLSFPRS